MLHSSPASYEQLLDELGSVQALSARISRHADSSILREVFSQVTNLIWRYAGDTEESLLQAAGRCQDYLSKFDRDSFVDLAPTLSEDICTLFKRLDALCSV